MLKCLFIFVIASLSLSTPLHALNGNGLHEMCKLDVSVKVGQPSFYVQGVWDQYAFSTDGTVKICLPKTVNYGQMADIVCAFLIEQPKYRHESAAMLTMLALNIAFPCSKPLDFSDQDTPIPPLKRY